MEESESIRVRVGRENLKLKVTITRKLIQKEREILEAKEWLVVVVAVMQFN